MVGGKPARLRAGSFETVATDGAAPFDRPFRNMRMRQLVLRQNADTDRRWPRGSNRDGNPRRPGRPIPRISRTRQTSTA